MDANQFNNLIQGLQALSDQIQAQVQAQQQAAAAAGAAPPAITAVSPYEGGALDVNSRVGSALFEAAGECLEGFKDEKYDGKPEHLYSLIAALKGRSEKCYWNSQAHSVVTNIGDDNLNLFNDYGRITKAQLVQARTDRQDNNNVRAQQNARMMYNSLWNSMTARLRENLDTDPELATDIRQDGPLMLWKLVTMSNETTFYQANAMRDQLHVLHPKRFSYDIQATNDFIRKALRVMRAASGDGATPGRQEALYFIFSAYKKIKTPEEWSRTIQFYENQLYADPANATKEALYEKGEALQQKIAKSPEGWHPSDKSPQEQVIAMLAEQKKAASNKDSKSGNEQGSNGRRNGKGRRGKRNREKSDKDAERPPPDLPPFVNSPGKEGDMKKYKGNTWYYCDFEHRHGHWVQHKPEGCKAKQAAKKREKNNDSPSTNSSGNSIKVERNSFKQSMSALFAGQGIDADTDALIDAALDSCQQE